MKEIEIFQDKIIKKCINFLKILKFKSLDISLSPLCFFTVWAKNPGKIKLDSILGKKPDYYYLLKNFLSIIKNYDLELFHNSNLKKNKKYKLIVTYSSKKNFNNKGEFYDEYFNINNKKQEILWCLISLDNFIPKKINNNIFIIAKKKNSYNFFYLFFQMIKLIINNKFNFNYFFYYCWFEFDYANKILFLFKKIINNIDVEKYLFNYEGIPFQNLLVKEIKKKNQNSTIFAYLHCAPWPVQTDLIYKDTPLDCLFVSSKSQKEVLQKKLGWNKIKIVVIPSLRFKKQKNKKFCGFIFTPFNLNNKTRYLTKLENYFLNLKNNDLGKLKVRVHPLNQLSRPHLELKREIEILLRKYKNNFKNKNAKFSIFLGSATGVCVQALEEGTTIIHFPEDKLTDVFCNKIWKYILVKKINNDIYQYRMTNFNKTFLVTNENSKFDKYLKF